VVRLFDAGARSDRPVVVHDKVVTVANGITAVRLLGLPLFVWLMVGPEAYGIALLVLILVAASDWIDGYVARRFDQVTKLGRILDPLIDRVLLATAGVTLLVVGFLPWWIVALIVARDAVLLVGSLLRFGAVPPIPVSRTGKFATACLLIGVPAFLPANMDFPLAWLAEAIAWIFTPLGIVAYYAAGVQYAKAARRIPRRPRRARAG
jgi:cardiolipin synthase